jgi:hypothetical protein
MFPIFSTMYTTVQSNTTFIIQYIIKRYLTEHNSEVFRLVYRAIVRLQLKRHFDIQLAISLKCEHYFTLECETEK